MVVQRTESRPIKKDKRQKEHLIFYSIPPVLPINNFIHLWKPQKNVRFTSDPSGGGGELQKDRNNLLPVDFSGKAASVIIRDLFINTEREYWLLCRCHLRRRILMLPDRWDICRCTVFSLWDAGSAKLSCWVHLTAHQTDWRVLMHEHAQPRAAGPAGSVSPAPSCQAGYIAPIK